LIALWATRKVQDVPEEIKLEVNHDHKTLFGTTKAQKSERNRKLYTFMKQNMQKIIKVTLVDGKILLHFDLSLQVLNWWQ